MIPRLRRRPFRSILAIEPSVGDDHPNPYQPPPVPPRVPLLWGRSVFAQLGFGLQCLAFIVHAVVTVHSQVAVPPTGLAAEPWLVGFVAGSAIVGLALVSVTALTKKDWPLHQRLVMIGIDLPLVGVLAIVTNGFGLV